MRDAWRANAALEFDSLGVYFRIPGIDKNLSVHRDIDPKGFIRTLSGARAVWIVCYAGKLVKVGCYVSDSTEQSKICKSDSTAIRLSHFMSDGGDSYFHT